MNRASLLHILDHPSGISEAEVRELEQLAAAFPYCQTAHLLLAKAAHDRGSMLAGQRLRRAATYAADRELLRALIERPAPEPASTATSLAQPAPTAAPEVLATPTVVSPQELSADAASPEGSEPVATPELSTTGSEDMATAQGNIEVSVVAPDELESEVLAATPESDEVAQFIGAEAETTTAESAEPEPEVPAITEAQTVADPTTEPAAPLLAAAAAEIQPAETQADQPQLLEAVASRPETSPTAATTETTAATGDATEEVEADAPAAEADAPATVTEAPVEAEAAETSEPASITAEALATASPEVSAETVVRPSNDPRAVDGEWAPVPLPMPSAEVPAETADELPPAAPPIRPPVEAGSSRFEFGLGEAPEPLPAYQLPELPAEESAPPAGGFPPFRADELLAYVLSGGSRLGSALTLRTPELTTDLPQETSWPADAAVLAHIAANRPASPPAPSSLALIDKFLRSQPRIKNAQRPTSADSPQADLSVRSTSATPSIASESLAKIMAKQGKIGRAIEIYEQLMQRQPEKKAYFAAQIDLLNQHPE